MTGLDNLIFLCSKEPLDDNNNKIFNLSRPFLVVMTQPWSVQHIILPDAGTITDHLDFPVTTRNGTGFAAAKSIDFTQIKQTYGVRELPPMSIIYRGSRYLNLVGTGYDHLEQPNTSYAWNIFRKTGRGGSSARYITIDSNNTVHFRDSIPTGETVIADIDWGTGSSSGAALDYNGGALPISGMHRVITRAGFFPIGLPMGNIHQLTIETANGSSPQEPDMKQYCSYPLFQAPYIHNSTDINFAMLLLRNRVGKLPNDLYIRAEFMTPDLTPIGYSGALPLKIDEIQETIKDGRAYYISR